MSRNHKFFFDQDGSPKARGPAAEKIFMNFLEVDVQGSDYICRDLMDDLTAIEDESDDSREFIGNAHHVTITPEGVMIMPNLPESETGAEPTEQNGEEAVKSSADQGYLVALKHFREILEDWEAFILDDQLDDPMVDDEFL
ncbi:MAG: hypothetical protein AB8B79_01715 [Granulosicoccus sp.]